MLTLRKLKGILKTEFATDLKGNGHLKDLMDYALIEAEIKGKFTPVKFFVNLNTGRLQNVNEKDAVLLFEFDNPFDLLTDDKGFFDQTEALWFCSEAVINNLKQYRLENIF